MSNVHVNADINPEKSGFFRKAILVIAPIAVVVGFIVLAGIIVASQKKPEEKREAFNPLAVLASVAVKKDVQLVIATQGEARPQTEIDLVPEVGGKITYVSPKFIQGGSINKGDVLYQIDKRDYSVAVVRAEAAVAQAQQVLVRQKAEAAIARQDWADLGTGTPSDLTLYKPQMAEAEAGLQSAEANLENAKIQLARTTVYAPFTGRVRSKTSDIGQYVSPGTPLGRIFSTNIIEVRLPLTDNDLSKVNLPLAYVAKSRETAPEVTLSATVGGVMQTWSGHIMRTDSAFDTQTRALFAIVEVDDPYGEGASENGVPLAPGLFVDAEIKGKAFEDIIVIPRDGLRPENKVYVAQQDGSADIVRPVVLDTNIDSAYITSGLKDGDVVILSPVEESRLSGPLKVLDINDIKKVYVDPPKPDWLIEKERKANEKGSPEQALAEFEEAKQSLVAAKMKLRQASKKLKAAKKAAKKKADTQKDDSK